MSPRRGTIRFPIGRDDGGASRENYIGPNPVVDNGGDNVNADHKDGDPDKTQEEYDRDNHSDQENPNNDEYDK